MRTTLQQQLLDAIECHEPQHIADALAAGVGANEAIDGRTPVQWLMEMYTRSPRLTDCLRVMLDARAESFDPVLQAVLLDDATTLRRLIDAAPARLTDRVCLKNAFTPLLDATLLHVAAEYVRVEAARTLIELGAALDARAGVDADGLNGHTPLFHTVNSNANLARPIMDLLLDAGAATDLRLAGITWGAGFEWETVLFDVTPVSFAQFGLLPQVHRHEADIYDNIARLLHAAGRPVPTFRNVPNQYLAR